MYPAPRIRPVALQGARLRQAFSSHTGAKPHNVTSLLRTDTSYWRAPHPPARRRQSNQREPSTSSNNNDERTAADLWSAAMRRDIRSATTSMAAASSARGLTGFFMIWNWKTGRHEFSWACIYAPLELEAEPEKGHQSPRVGWRSCSSFLDERDANIAFSKTTPAADVYTCATLGEALARERDSEWAYARNDTARAPATPLLLLLLPTTGTHSHPTGTRVPKRRRQPGNRANRGKMCLCYKHARLGSLRLRHPQVIPRPPHGSRKG
ncbi:hypothetical protein BC826DRAFT_972630 [Russula brevipes]|nr:hypothetical protein BC826DRAFT_972630 [Russula brevipes]